MGTIKYNSLAVYVGPNIVSGDIFPEDIKQMSRIQSTNYQIEIQQDPISSLGTIALNDANSNIPYVNFSMEYLVTNGRNEGSLGFTTDGERGALLGLISGERDIFIKMNNSNPPAVMCIGNAMVSKYTVTAAVNELLKASVELRGFNIQIDEGTSGNISPRVDKFGNRLGYKYALPTEDIFATDRKAGFVGENLFASSRQLGIDFLNNYALGTMFNGENSSHLQNFSISIQLDRSEVSQLGEKYPQKRDIKFPIEISVAASLLLDKVSADNISNYFCQNLYDIDLNVYDNNCSTINKLWETEKDTIRLKYSLRGLRLKSIQSRDAIGENKSVTFEWSVPVGNIFDLKRNLFISGDYGRYYFQTDSFNVLATQISGGTVQPVTREIEYKRIKFDSSEPDFNLHFSGNYDLAEDTPDYAKCYNGSIEVINGSGNFGSGLSSRTFEYISDSFSSAITANVNCAESISTFHPSYPYGTKDNSSNGSFSYPFVIKGLNLISEPVHLSIADKPTWLDASFDYDDCPLTASKLFFFNRINMSINNMDIPTGYSFSFDVIANSSRFKKLYRLECTTPHSFRKTIPDYYREKTCVFLEPYNEFSMSTVDGYVSTMKNESIRGEIFSGNNSVELVVNGLDEGSYLHFNGGEGLYAKSFYPIDFRAFTLFVLYKPLADSSENASLIRFSCTGISGVNTNFAAIASIERFGDNLSFAYANNSGVSGIYPGYIAPINISGGWSGDWTLAMFKNNWGVVNGKLNRVSSVTQVAPINAPITFNAIQVGGGFHGDIAELLLLPFVLDENQVTEIENYFMYKWRK